MKSRRVFATELTACCLAMSFATCAAEKAPASPSTDFDLAVERLPRNFVPVNSAAVLDALGKMPSLTKGEFETSQEYSARYAKWRKQGAWTTGRLIALSVPQPSNHDQFSVRYDADGQMMHVEVKPGYQCGPGHGLAIASSLRDAGSYVGSNAFGVKKSIKKSLLNVHCIFGIPHETVSFPMDREKAKREKASIRAILIGRIVEPFLESSSDYHSPTVTEPHETAYKFVGLKFDLKEVWAYNSVTGEIYSRPKAQSGASAGSTADLPADFLDSNGNTALHLAIWNGDSESATKIIWRGVKDLNQRNKFGATPLFLAVSKGDELVVRTLLGAGADRAIPDNDGSTPLMEARSRGLEGIANALEAR